ncbi:MAG: hypothetical protein KJ904_17960 [Alphaproteobacteria bacterium]|nr:hypothetical protein [Alphaproteobacteria bacterium]MBU0889044.1 hypothetical protein [Alphaproteobacteria bacterium]MBU1814064.1 hypothetical protein [Alphaproteobacteria bacterium]
MTASRINPALAILLATACFAASQATAQTGQPLRLFPLPGDSAPQTAPAQPGSPRAAEPSPGVLPAPGALPGGADLHSRQPIQGDPSLRLPPDMRAPLPAPVAANELAAPTIDSIGVLDPSRGGLGFAMWNGTPQPRILRLLDSLPTLPGSHAMRSLQRRLLLTTANAPASPAAATETAPVLTRRAELLMRMGAVSSLSELLRQIPRNAGGETLDRLQVETLILSGDTQAACTQVGSTAGDHAEIFWRKAQIVCDALARESGRVDLGITLLRELKAPDDQPFYRLVEAAMGNNVVLDSLPESTALHLALLRAANMPVPPDAVTNASPAMLTAIAVADYAAYETRLAAAERGVSLGVVPPGVLSELYNGVQATPKELADAIRTLEASPSPTSRAALYRRASIDTDPVKKAELIAAGLRFAARDGVYDHAVRVLDDLIRQLQPTADLVWFAPEAARALYAVGDIEAARPWLVALRDRGVENPDARAAWLRLWPLARLAGETQATIWEQSALDSWAATLTTQSPQDAERRIAIMSALLNAVGEPVEPTDFILALGASGGTTPASGITMGLDNAAAAGRIGETVALALIANGTTPPRDLDPVVLNRSIQALRLIGLEKDARRLALEAAIDHGF